MDSNTMDRLAYGAVKQFCAKYGFNLSYQDHEDCVQSAYLGIVEALSTAPIDEDRQRAYCFTAAYRSVIRHMFRVWRVGPFAAPLDETIGVVLETHDDFFTDERKAAIVEMLYLARSNRGKRGLRAAEQDCRILELRCCGWTQRDIANEIGLSVYGVDAALERIRQKLSAIYMEVCHD